MAALSRADPLASPAPTRALLANRLARVEAERVQLVCLVTLTLIAVRPPARPGSCPAGLTPPALQGAAALHWLEPVMVPLVLAVLLSYCLSPVVELAERRAGLPHGYVPACSSSSFCGGLTDRWRAPAWR